MTKFTSEDYPIANINVGDKIELAGFEIEVSTGYLQTLSHPAELKFAGPSNGYILKYLGIKTPKDFMTLMKPIYDRLGQRLPDKFNGDFPEVMNHPAVLTHLINALFNLGINKKLIKSKYRVKIQRHRGTTKFTYRGKSFTVAGEPMFIIKHV